MPQTLNAFRTHIELAAGELLFGEGDDGAFAYVVEAGELEVFVIRDDGDIDDQHHILERRYRREHQ